MSRLEQGGGRRLAAVMFADVAGFSALMERSESTTFSRLRRLREEVCAPIIEAHSGRFVKSTGDGFLAEFQSAAAAVRCGVQIQTETIGIEAAQLPGDRIHFRIGINLGDVIVDGTDIAGDGVNIAARLEGLSPVGGLCVSSAVFEQLRDDVGVSFSDQGERRLKNISRPMRVYTASVPASEDDPAPSLPAARRTVRRLSVVVLPFANLSGDSSQDYFADGITDEVTVQLSRLKGSYVVGRETAFSFRGKRVNVKSIGNELGVRYVLQGGVEKLDSGADGFVSLTDTVTGELLWTEDIEADRDGIRNIRKDVVSRLANALNLQLVRAEASRSLREDGENPDAVDLVMRGWAQWHQHATLEGLRAAEACFRAALKIGEYQPALTALAQLLATRALSWPAERKRDVEEAERAATRAIELDREDAAARHALSRVHLQCGRLQAALAENELALEMDANLAAARAFRGLLMVRAGRPGDALEHITRALAQSPKDPVRWSWLTWAGHSLLCLGRHGDALPWLEKAFALSPNALWPASNLMVAQVHLGNLARAGELRQRILEIERGFSIALVAEVTASSNPDYVRIREQQYLEPLRRLGIPEE